MAAKLEMEREAKTMETKTANPVLRCGDVVMVYKDPVTRQKPEGKATLRRFLDRTDGEHSGRLEFWEVHFHADTPGFRTNRWVGLVDRQG